jgi:hypothetical protein
MKYSSRIGDEKVKLMLRASGWWKSDENTSYRDLIGDELELPQVMTYYGTLGGFEMSSFLLDPVDPHLSTRYLFGYLSYLNDRRVLPLLKPHFLPLVSSSNISFLCFPFLVLSDNHW